MRARRAVPGWVVAIALLVTGVFIVAPGPSQQAEAAVSRVIAPLEFGISSGANAVRRLVETVQQAGELADQNKAYRDQLDRLESEVVQMRELELENRDLRRLLGLRERAPAGSLLPVNVIARDPLAMVQAVMVDRGSSDGVAVNLPVITWRGVVGRVIETQPTAAKVLLVTDVNSGVSARIQDPASRATGVIRGTGDGRLLLQYVPRTDRLRTGDTAITSAIGGVFPSGLVIGRILQIRQKDVEVFQEALVEPAVDMRNLERVYILLGASRPIAEPPANGQAPGSSEVRPPESAP